jgi:transcriptional regulator with XRE-family HTH domain
MAPITLGEAIRRVRIKRGFSLMALADATNYDGTPLSVHATSLGRIEQGLRYSPRVGTLLAICEVLNIEIRLTPTGLQVLDLEEGD